MSEAQLADEIFVLLPIWPAKGAASQYTFMVENIGELDRRRRRRQRPAAGNSWG